MHWLLLAFCAGLLLAVQTAINGRLGKEMSQPILAALASFAIGTACLILYCLLSRPALSPAFNAGRIPLWAWCGGLLGAVYLAAVISLVPRIGVGTLLSLVVAGQMFMAALLDHRGLFGLERHPLNLWRLLGMGLIVAGVVLVRR